MKAKNKKRNWLRQYLYVWFSLKKLHHLGIHLNSLLKELATVIDTGKIVQTREHSSRMFTVRLPTISYVIPCSMSWGWVPTPPPWTYGYPSPGHTQSPLDTHSLYKSNAWIRPGTRDTDPPPGDMVPEITPNGQTLHFHTTLFVGGQAGRPAANELSS